MAVISVVLAILLIVLYLYTINNIARSIDRALDPNQGSTLEADFNIEGAKQLNLKGLSPAR